MALATGSTAQVNFGALLTDILAAYNGGTNPIQVTYPQGVNQTYALGTGSATANQFQLAGVGSFSVTNGTAGTIDLNSGACANLGSTTTLKSPAGVAFTPVAAGSTGIIALILSNTSASGNLLFGNAVSNGWAAFLGATGVATILPGFTLALFGTNINGSAAGYATGATTKVLNFNASAGTVNFNLYALSF